MLLATLLRWSTLWAYLVRILSESRNRGSPTAAQSIWVMAQPPVSFLIAWYPNCGRFSFIAPQLF